MMIIHFSRFLLLIGLAVGFLGGCSGNQAKPRNSTQVYNPEFSPDGEKLVFTYCRINLIGCDLGMITLKSGDVRVYPAPDGSSWGAPAFSPDGKKIAFNGFDTNAWGKSIHFAALYTMDADGTGIRQLVSTNAHRVGPTFSPDGKRLIYVASEVKRVSMLTGRIFGKHIREFSLSDGQERVLLDSVGLSPSKAYYLPIGNSFLFSGSRKVASTYGDYYDQAIWKGRLASKETVRYISSDDLLNVPGIDTGFAGHLAGISRDGSTVAFQHKAGLTPNGTSKHTIVIFKDEKYHVTNFTIADQPNNKEFSGIISGGAALSANGNQIAFSIYDPGKKNRSLWVSRVDGTNLRKLDIP